MRTLDMSQRKTPAAIKSLVRKLRIIRYSVSGIRSGECEPIDSLDSIKRGLSPICPKITSPYTITNFTRHDPELGMTVFMACTA